MRVVGLMVAAAVITCASAYGQGVAPGGVGTNGAAIRGLRVVVPQLPDSALTVDATATEREAAAKKVLAELDAARKGVEDRDKEQARRAQVDADCAPLLWSDVPRVWPTGRSDEPTLVTLDTCVLEVMKDLENVPATPVSRESRLALIKLHVQYKQFKAWSAAASARNARGTQEILLRARVAKLGERLHDALGNMGIYEPLSAMLFTGAAFGDAANAEAGAGTAEDGGAAKAAGTPVGPSAMIVFESPHFGDDRKFPLHVAFGGKVGFQQLMAMVKPEAEDDANADSTPVAAYKDGILWGAGMSLYRGTGGKAEAYARASIGGTHIGDGRSVLEGENKRGFLAVPADAGTGASAARSEIAIGWNYYGRPMEFAHLDKSLLNPAFSVYGLWRKDRRFRRVGDLAGFENPEGRWAYGMSVNLRKLVMSDGDSVESLRDDTFDFGFAVEREFARGIGLRIPDSTRYVLRGTVDILNALSGAKKPAANTGAAGGAGAPAAQPPAGATPPK